MGKAKITQIYDLKDVVKGYDYYKVDLLNKIISLFQWEGLPETLPDEEIEKKLLLNGFCGVYKHPIYGIITTDASISGISVYFTGSQMIFTNPIAGSHTLKIGKECVCGFNDILSKWSWNSHISEVIDRYARQLSDIDSSISIALINSRATATPVSDNDAIAQSFREYRRKLEEGALESIVTRSMVEGFNLLNNPVNDNRLTELYNAYNEVVKNFYMTIGVPFSEDKRERLINAEVTRGLKADEFNIYSMLKMREKFAEEINNMFNLSCSVKINDILTQSYSDDNEEIMEGDEENVN